MRSPGCTFALNARDDIESGYCDGFSAPKQSAEFCRSDGRESNALRYVIVRTIAVHAMLLIFVSLSCKRRDGAGVSLGRLNLHFNLIET